VTAESWASAAILWADDDHLRTRRFAEELAAHGIRVFEARTAADAIALMQKPPAPILLAVIDVVIPAGATTLVRSSGDLRTGLMLAHWIRVNHPGVRLVGYSLEDSADVREWFATYGVPFFSKRITHYGIVEKIRRLTETVEGRLAPRIFIVHGHDEAAKYELKNFLQNSLKIGEPVVLQERSSGGRTVIEKFEQEAAVADVVFILFTPDETVKSHRDEATRMRARPNVLFEAGYFYGRLHRTSGKVIFLVKGDVELPSDVSGIVYIDISLGIQKAGEEIRRELAEWLK